MGGQDAATGGGRRQTIAIGAGATAENIIQIVNHSNIWKSQLS